MESRAAIEQAKGVLMSRHGVDADGAFDLLRQRSQAENRKLRDIARELLDDAARTGRDRHERADGRADGRAGG
jgi:AmiR/NasT family two-component response regulator